MVAMSNIFKIRDQPRYPKPRSRAGHGSAFQKWSSREICLKYLIGIGICDGRCDVHVDIASDMDISYG